MRQKDDSAFAELLNRLRHNKITDDDKGKIKQCLIDPKSVNDPQNAPLIFAENSFMQLFRMSVLMKSQTSSKKGNVGAKTRSHLRKTLCTL